MKQKTCVVSIRINYNKKKFLEDLVKEMNKNSNHTQRFGLSDFLNNMIDYFIMAYTIGQWNKPLSELRKDFIDYLNSIGKTPS